MTWQAALAAISDSAAALAWNATCEVTSSVSWSWYVPPQRARASAYVWSRDAMAPVEAACQGAAWELAAMLRVPATHTGD